MSFDHQSPTPPSAHPPTSRPLGPPSSMVPPGWYPDPSGLNTWQWWTGYEWIVSPQATPANRSAGGRAWFPDLAPLRFPAALFAAGVALVLWAMNMVSQWGGEATVAIIGLMSLTFAAVGFPVAAWYACRRWGSGSWVHDLQLRPRLIDGPLGLVGGVGLLISSLIVGVASVLIGLPQGSNLDEVKDVAQGEPATRVALFITLFLLAGLMAPITEELVFRGVMLRGLLDRVGMWPAILIQGVFFGSIHFLPSQGWGNLSMLLVLSATGIGLGFITRLTGRLAPAMVAHATFNCTQLALLWATL